ncbi:MAG: regulatory protein RecX [Chromatiaceae bacterium]|nr:MAG: regulatory protein RecX [Chromatiaceae bacterium]
MAAPPPSAPAAEIRDRALKLLTNREHSRAELARKLGARGYPAPAIEAVLDGLIADGLLDESRLLAAYVAERLEKGFGPLRIRAELQGKGLSDARISPYLDLDEETCLARMTAARARRFGPVQPADRAELARQARFLEYRGFPSHLIARLLDIDH